METKVIKQFQNIDSMTVQIETRLRLDQNRNRH